MGRLTVIWGPIMYLPEAPWCKDSVTPFGPRQKKRVEEEDIQSRAEHGVQVTALTDLHEKIYTGAARASELHNLPSHHHRPNGEGIPVPVGDISKAEGREGRMGRPSPSLQHLMDCTVFLNSNEMATIHTSCTSILRAPHSSTKGEA